MTKEEAIKKLQRHKAEYLDEWVDFSGITEALDMAIKALEQEPTYYPPCIDCHKKMDEIRRTYDKLNEQEPCEDAISRQAVLDATVKRNSIWNAITNSKGENLEEIISQLPPVTPKPKTGHWKVISDGYGDNAYICECSECKDTIWVYKDADRKWNYCPNCGAKMTESEDKE